MRPLLLALCLLLVLPVTADEVWLLVETAKQRLTVMDGDQATEVFDDIAIGRNGASHNKRRFDQTTPLGRFRIAWIDSDTSFHRFFGLDYPDIERSERAHKSGQISARQLERIRFYHRADMTPPQHTPLGGHIGIHGIGKGDPDIHRRFNWTNGCIALTNEQIEQLEQQIEIGTVVEIR